MGNETVRMGVGGLESKILSLLAAEGKTIFSIDELAEKTGSKTTARKMASILTRKRWLERLNRGTYLILDLAAGSMPEWSEDAFYVASKLAKPYYIGYLSMLHYYGWTEQIPTTITIATPKINREKNIHGVKYEFIMLSKKKFFGFREINIRGHPVLVSDPEKTMADALDHPEYCGGIDEVAKAIVEANVNWKKVITYARKMKNGALFKRMGFLLEKMDAPVSTEIMKEIRKRITKGYAPLYPTANPTGKYNTKWNICINVDFSKERALA